jgi:phosphoribosyl-dephospho-CoA transferase
MNVKEKSKSLKEITITVSSAATTLKKLLSIFSSAVPLAKLVDSTLELIGISQKNFSR